MSEEKKNVANVAVPNGTKEVKTYVDMVVRCERRHYEFTDERGVQRAVNGVSISAEIDGEHFTFKNRDTEGRLLGYILRKEGVALLDSNGLIVEE